MVAWAIWFDSTFNRKSHCVSTCPGESIRSRSSMSAIIPLKITIQTIQVLGGTLNSPPFRGVRSSSLYRLSSAILLLVRPKYHDHPIGATRHFPHPYANFIRIQGVFLHFKSVFVSRKIYVDKFHFAPVGGRHRKAEAIRPSFAKSTPANASSLPIV